MATTPASCLSSRRTGTFRFAPTPNGYLHRGHAFSALLNARAAEAAGGRFLLRIEDIDAGRANPTYEAAIFEDLAWLGLLWEEPVLRQRQRFGAYRAALDALQKLGLLYPAFLSRAEIAAFVSDAEAAGRRWSRDPDGAPLYPGPERGWTEKVRQDEINRGRPYALRLDMARTLQGSSELSWWEKVLPGRGNERVRVAANPAAWGDVVLARKEMQASYHLSVVVDDAFQEVTDVVRGMDLQPATSVHRLLQTLLGLPEPAYHHHRLILDETGRKLSKSRNSEALRARRLAGESAADLIAGLDVPSLQDGGRERSQAGTR